MARNNPIIHDSHNDKTPGYDVSAENKAYPLRMKRRLEINNVFLPSKSVNCSVTTRPVQRSRRLGVSGRCFNVPRQSSRVLRVFPEYQLICYLMFRAPLADYPP
ncbi:hypothetical protein J6590_035754 [Homalodisca vitripennis]|nr:hypothetical protein J6590_035754 [Homalodisca vitripennis]